MAGFAEYENHDATGLAELVAGGAVSAGELLDCALARAEALNPQLNALVHLRPDTARRHITDRLPDGPLRGVPFLLKDLGAEAIDFPSHDGSRLFADTRHAFDSEIYLRIQATGAVTFGRTTAPELGMGPVTEAQVYGAPTRNPWDLGRTPGGSSGGSGAAVAAGIVPVAHGSDGGGSVRIPAASCGLFGMKPTRARLPDGPRVGEGWGGMSINGFLTRSVRDSAVLLDACSGPDLGAPYWAPPLDEGFVAALQHRPAGLRVACSATSLTGAPLHPDCRAAVADVARLLADMGHHVVEAQPAVDIRALMRAWASIVACGTALSVATKAATRGKSWERDEIEGVTRGAIAHARTVSGSDYIAALNQVHAFGRAMARFFLDHDLFVTTTLSEPPTRIGRLKPDVEDFLDYRLGSDGVLPYSPTAPGFNASGQPAASVPLSWNADGLPIGVHIAAAFGRDELLMSVCAALEEARPWFDRRPPVRFASAV